MAPIEVASSYDQIAEQWNDPLFPRDNGVQQHERAIGFLKQQRGLALDIGCGSSGRIIDLLEKHGFTVEGLDLSSRMLELAKQRHPNITFHHADICEWVFPKQYDLISAWDSIWHVPLSFQESVLKKILQNLAPGGVCIFSAGGLDAPSEILDSTMGVSMYHGTIGVPNILKLLAEANCICRHLEYDQYPESHLFIIAQK